MKFFGYLKIRKLKHVLIAKEGESEISADDKETAFAELIQFLDERSISLIMRDALNDGRKAFQILKEHYAGSGKPRIISLYTQLTSLKKKPGEQMTDYILRAESNANALRNAKEVISDGLLVAMVVKGQPDDYKSFIAVTSQSEDIVQNFQKFKQASNLRNFVDTEKVCVNKPTGSTNENSVMKIKESHSHNKIVCYNCGTDTNRLSAENRKERSDGATTANQPLTMTVFVVNKVKSIIQKL